MVVKLSSSFSWAVATILFSPDPSHCKGAHLFIVCISSNLHLEQLHFRDTLYHSAESASSKVLQYDKSALQHADATF